MSVINDQTRVYVGNHYEKNITTSEITKYYYFGGQRVAMRNKTGLIFMHGDMLGSASLATSLTGGKISEMRYKPFGEVRLLSNQTGTDRTFTGQRVKRGIGNINNTLMVHILDDAVQHLPEATSPRSYFPKHQLGCTIAGMSRTQTDPSVLHYNSIASQYDQMLTSIPGDRWVRQAFQSFVTQHVPPGKLLLDFGCGTGTDALSYIERGYRVIGYDNSPGMLGELRHKCAAKIARGQIMCYSTPYRKFLSNAPDTGDPAPDAVTANFAVLNLIDELAPLFDAFAKMLATQGQVIVSVLNPFFWKEMIHLAWWKANRSEAHLCSPPAVISHHTLLQCIAIKNGHSTSMQSHPTVFGKLFERTIDPFSGGAHKVGQVLLGDLNIGLVALTGQLQQHYCNATGHIHKGELLGVVGGVAQPLDQ